MAITAGICNSFKLELLSGIHDFENDVIKAALYTEDADIGPSTTAYTVTEEVSGSGYTAGGATASVEGGYPALNGNFAEVRFGNVDWASVSVTFRGVLFYNSSKANRAIAVYDRGSNITVVSGLLRIRVPSGDLAPITIT